MINSILARVVVFLIILLLSVVSFLHGQDAASLIPRAALFAERERWGVALSPDGGMVGHIAPVDGRPQLWLAPVDDPAQRRQVTHGGVAVWHWTFGRRRAIVVEPSANGDRLLLLDTESGGLVDHTPQSGGSLQVVGLSPERPDEAVVAVRAADPSVAGLYRVDLREPKSERMQELAGCNAWYFDGALRLRVARRPGWHGDTLLRVTGQGELRQFIAYGPYDSRFCGVVSVSSDGATLYAVDNRGDDKGVLKSIDLATRHETIILKDSLADILSQGAVISPLDGRVQAVVSYHVRLRRHFLDTSIAADFERLASVRSGDVSFVGSSLDQRRWLVRYLDGAPPDYYLYDRTTGKATHLFSEMPSLDRFTLARRHKFVVRSRDGLQLPCDLYLPAGSDADGDGVPDKPLPTLLYVHGGPWVGFEWNLWQVNCNFQLLANRGYAVIRTDFRGTIGFGRAFHNAGNQEWGGAMHTDLVDIARAAVDRKVAAKDRLGIWGWSYGGYATFAALAFEPDLFACGISMYGLSDINEFMERRMQESGGEGWGEWLRRVGDIRTEEGRALLRRHSPINSADRVTKPLLVTHGGADAIVPWNQSQRMVDTLVALGRPVTWLYFPEEQHDYRSYVSWQAFWSVGERFLHEHLGGAYEPFGTEVARANCRVLNGLGLIPGLREAGVKGG